MASLKKTMPLEIERDVDYGMGGPLETMTIKVANVSMDYLNGISEANPNMTWHQARAAAVVGMVSKWDLRGPVPLADTGDLKEGSVVPEDELIPLDPDVIAKLPEPVVEGLVQGIWAAATPKRGTASGTSTETPSE